MTAEELVEVEAIKVLKARYFRLMDQKRWEEWAEVFAEDATLHTPDDVPGAPPLRGRAAIVAAVRRAIHDCHTVHHGHMPEVEIEGPTRARGTWSMEDHLEFPPGGQRRVVHGRGFYVEEYEKGADGRWRIRSLELRRLWLQHDGRQILPAGPDRH